MISVQVTYTVKPVFAATNQKNVNAFIEDVRRLSNPNIRYEAYLADDRKTFIHYATFADENTQKQLLGLQSFKFFQKQRDESGLEVAPEIKTLNLVASSNPVFESTI